LVSREFAQLAYHTVVVVCCNLWPGSDAGKAVMAKDAQTKPGGMPCCNKLVVHLFNSFCTDFQ